MEQQVTVQRLVDNARRARTEPADTLSPIMLTYGLRSALDHMIAGGVTGLGKGPLHVAARVIAALIANLEDGGPST